MNMSSEPGGYNETNELARARTRAAADRTLMAWVRTSLALIGFGFGIERIVEAIASQQHVVPGLTAFVSLSFIALGVYGLIASSLGYRREIQSLEEGRYEFKSEISHPFILATILAVVGAVAFFGLLARVFVGSNH